MTTWESEDAARQAGEKLAGWVRQEMGPSLENVDSHIGEIAFDHGNWPERGQYCLVNFWRFKQNPGALTERVWDELVPLIARRQGFVGYMAVRGTGDVSTTVCTAYRTQADAERAPEAEYAGWARRTSNRSRKRCSGTRANWYGACAHNRARRARIGQAGRPIELVDGGNNGTL